MRLPGLLLLVLAGGATAFLHPPTPVLTTTTTSNKLSVPSPRLAPSTHRRPLLLRAQQDDEEVEGIATSFFAQRGTLRPLVTGLAWLGFVFYATNFAPGMDETARALDQKLLTDLIADPLAPSVTPLFGTLRG